MVDNTYITYRYRKERTLGAGGMGVVLQATDLLTQKLVALKQILSDREAGNRANTAQRDLRLAMAREFRILASLRHPNIISVLDYGQDDSGQPFYTMELLQESDNLLHVTTRSPSDTVHLLIDILQALMYLHRHGIIHRDLKPDNVLIDAQNTVRVLDFGLSQHQNETSSMAGTLAYMSPELLLEKPASPQADLYAVGVMAYQLFEKRHPFHPTDDLRFLQRVLHQSPASFTDNTPQTIRPVIQRLLAKDPHDRYDSAEATIIAFSRAIDEPPPPETASRRESFIQAARFIGREAEMQRLTQALHDMQQSDDGSSIWLIGGESGVGKSRLLDEVRTQALVAGIPVLSGQVTENTQSPFHLWHSIVRHLVLMTPHEPHEVAIFQAMFGDIDTLTGNPIPDVPETADITTLFKTRLRMLLHRQTRPVLLLLEDLQWADDSLMPLIALAEQHIPGLMIIGTYRDDERPDLPQSIPQATVISLERLSSDDIKALSVSILGDAGQQEQVTDLLERETQGNAFFIVEVIRALAESAGRLSAVGSVTLENNVFTAGMRRLIDRRLGRIPQMYRHLLHLAAIQGRSLDVPILSTLSDTPVEDFLYSCARPGVLEVRDNQWRFVHDKFREAVLESLPHTDKSALHRQVATAIEQQTDDPMTRAEELAYHWRRAVDTSRESVYVLQAARTAFKNSLFRDAWQWMQRAIEIDALSSVNSDIVERATFLRRVGSAAYQLGKYDEAIQYHLDARALLKGTSHLATLANVVGSLGDICALTGRLDEAETYLNEGLQYARQSGDKERIGIVLMNIAAFEARRGNAPQAIKIMKDSYEHLKETDNLVDLAKALNNVALGYGFEENYDDALVYNQKALELRQQLNDQHGLISSYINIGNIYMRHFDKLQKASEFLKKAFDMAQRLALHKERIFTQMSLSELAEKQQDYERAKQHLLDSVQLARRIQNPMLLGEQLTALSDFYYRHHRISAAAETLCEALIIRQEADHTYAQDVLINRSVPLLAACEKPRLAYMMLSYAEKAGMLNPDNTVMQHEKERLQQQLPPETVRDVTEQGRNLSQDEAVQRVLDALQPST